jgi:hypothetical protein
MLIHQQNLYEPCGKQRPSHGEAQGHATGQQSKNPHCI